MAMGSPSLTVQGITWTYQKYNNKSAYGFQHHAISFNPNTGLFHIQEDGETVFVGKSVVECLEVAHEYVWEYYARQFVPVWENPAFAN